MPEVSASGAPDLVTYGCVMDERRAIAGLDAVDRALVNGTLGLLADDIQWIYWQAGQPCDDAMARQIAAD